MTQELLARLIEVQRNAISIVAHTLQQAGIISYSRGRIEIMNDQALQETANVMAPSRQDASNCSEKRGDAQR